MPRGKIPREARELFEKARRNEAGSRPRKHHLVPASYLRRWAEDGKLRVTVVDEQRSYLSAPETAARETDYYRLEHPDLDPDAIPPLMAETLLGELEGNATGVIDELIQSGTPSEVNVERMVLFAWHLATTITRGKVFRDESRDMLTDMYRLQYQRVTDEGIARRLRQHGMEATPEAVAENREFLNDLQTGDIWVEHSQPAVVALALSAAEELGEHLLDRVWVVFECPPVLVTCDEPVVAIGGPGASRSERVGLADAGVLVFPLCPTALLAMFHPEIPPTPPWKLDRVETAEVNREVVAAATRWAFERPSRHATERLQVPPAPAKASVRDGPIPQVEGAEGELYSWYRPTRWADSGSAPPPWPVSRWWPPGWRARGYPGTRNLPLGAKVKIERDSPKDGSHGRRSRKRR